MDHYKGDRFGLVAAYWGLALALGIPQVSQTDYTEKGETFGATLPLSSESVCRVCTC